MDDSDRLSNEINGEHRIEKLTISRFVESVSPGGRIRYSLGNKLIINLTLSNCFVGGTKVTPNEVKNIEDAIVGDYKYTTHLATSQCNYAKP